MLDEERQSLFKALLTVKTHEQVWRHATRLVRTREDAEDLLQDALIAAYRKLHQLRQLDAFVPWLLVILRSCSLNLAARRKPPEFAKTLWFHSAGQIEQPHPLSEEIMLALSSLPAAHREVLALFYLDGLSLEETGRVLRITALAVSQRLYRARRSLRQALERTSPSAAIVSGQSHES